MEDEFEPIYIQDEKRNIYDVKQDKNCINLLNEIKYIRIFFGRYFDLQFGRNVIFLRETSIKPFKTDLILFSIQQTLGSIEACCHLGNFSDAYILLRKYRDDLFFHLYLFAILKEQPKDNDKVVQNIKAWLGNKLSDLNISEVLKYIGSSKNLASTTKKYNLQKSFDVIGIKLNNFTHANGVSFYNKLFFHHQMNNEQEKLCDDLGNILNYITTVFVFLSTLCYPLSIMSTDYTDYLDCNATPPEDCQYWVAPFIIKFFEQRKNLIDTNCLKYLQDNTGMKLLEE